MNAQVWSSKHPDFLVVAECHGTAQVAHYDQVMWHKYQLTRLAGDAFKTNSLLISKPAKGADARDVENPAGAFSPADNSIPALRRRGMVFMFCHNAIWEQAAGLMKANINPDKLTIEAMAAELTNHLLPGVVLTPGAVGTLPELQAAGFHYIT